MGWHTVSTFNLLQICVVLGTWKSLGNLTHLPWHLNSFEQIYTAAILLNSLSVYVFEGSRQMIKETWHGEDLVASGAVSSPHLEHILDDVFEIL